MSKQRVVVFLAVLFILFLSFIAGCKSSNEHNYAAQYYGVGTLSGNIALSNANPSLRLQASGTPAVGAEVWVEELPTLRASTDSSGNYLIKNVPIGNFHVVAKLIFGGNTYKMRSNPCKLNAGDETKNDFSIFQAKNIVKGVIKSEDGQTLPPGTQIWLWGESFIIDENGRFETPPMPTFAGLDAIHEIVVNRGQPNEFRIPVSFVADDQPLEVDLTVPANQGNVNTLPKVTLIATVNGELCKKIMQGDQVTFTAIVFPKNATDLTWNATRGSFNQSTQTDGNKRIKNWIAPAVSGLATVSVELKNSEGKIAKAFLPILVEGIPNYSVNFAIDGGSAVASQTVAMGQEVIKPADPVKQGFTFAGWFKDSEKTVAFDFATEIISANTTIYAKWTVNPTYSVTYNGNGNTGGEAPTDSNKYEESATVTVLGNTGTLIKTNYSFVGWNTKDDGTGTNYSADATFSMGTKDLILYAKWSINSHTVTFNKNNGDIEADPVTKTVNHGESLEALPTAPTRTGYTFSGWNTVEDGSGTSFAANTTVNVDLTVYAQWTIKNYTVTFNVDGGSVVASQNITHGQKVTQPANPTKTGHAFSGWFKDSNKTTTFDFATETIAADTTIYAKWTINNYAVTFNVDGGSVVASQNINYGQKVTQPANPTKANHTFGGWFKDSAKTEAFDFATETITANTTIYAKWTINKHEVTFNVDGGSAVASQNINYGQKATKPTDPTKAIHTFGGWFKDSAKTEAFDFATETITANTTIYAKWTINNYEVTFNVDGGSTVASQNINYGQKATKPTDPTKTGHTFAGWFKDSAKTVVFDFTAETISANITIYAKWTINTYTISFDSNGGTAVNPTTKSADHGSNVGSLPAAPTRTNYFFTGWNTEYNGTGTSFTETTAVTSDITVHAQWLFWTFGTEGTGAGQFKYPHGLAIDNSGNIYVAEETGDRVQKFGPTGNYLGLLGVGSSGSANGQFSNPTDVVIDSSGNLFVLDRGNHRIQKFDANGNYISQFGSFGTGDGQFRDTRGMAIDSTGNIFVADFSNSRVQKFDSNGNYVSQFGTAGTDDGQFIGAFDVAVDSSNNIYVTEYSNKRVQKFDSDGGFLFKFGIAGTGVGQLKGPNGIAVDSEGNIYVTDWLNHCVQKYNSAGVFVSQVGSMGSGKLQFNNLRMIRICGDKLIVAEGSNHRVQIIDKF